MKSEEKTIATRRKRLYNFYCKHTYVYLHVRPLCYKLRDITVICLFLLLSAKSNGQDLSNGLVGYYTFCDCTATDISGNNRHGTIIGSPTCVKGRYDRGLLLNQTSATNSCGQPGGQYVQLPALDAIWSKGFTIAAWVRFDDVKKYQRIIDFGNRNGEAGGMNILFGRDINSNNLILESWIDTDSAVSRSKGRLTAINAIRPDSLEHYAATIYQDTMRIYVNGVLVAQKKGHPIANVARTRNYIGRSLWCTYDPDFKGLIDEVRIYNRSLNAQEISKLFQGGDKEFAFKTACTTTKTDFNYSNTLGVDSLKWDFGEVSSPINSATGSSPSHTYGDTGLYLVKLVVYKVCGNDTLTKQVKINMGNNKFLGPDFSICPGTPKLLKPAYSGETYLWSNGSSEESITITRPDLYWLQIRAGNCVYIDSVAVGSLRKHESAKAVVCEGQSFYGYSSTGIYRDTFALSNGCDSIRTLDLLVEAKKVVRKKVSICHGESYLLPWGQQISTAGNFADTLRRQSGCDSVVREFAISVSLLPEIRIAKSNDIDCSVRTATLTATGGEHYSWTPANSITHPSGSKTLASPTATTIYHVRVTTAAGCTKSDSVLVVVSSAGSSEGFYVSSAFTPNRDGKNDHFGVIHWGNVRNFRFTISNRWGEVIFTTNDAKKQWDGTHRGQWQPSATYVYVISADTDCGKVSRKGTVTLIR